MYTYILNFPYVSSNFVPLYSLPFARICILFPY